MGLCVRSVRQNRGTYKMISLLSRLKREDGVDDMANLIVRNLDVRIVRALKRRAAQNERSAEAEHRKILADALLKPAGRSFAEALLDIPEVGVDEDFERVDSTEESGRASHESA